MNAAALKAHKARCMAAGICWRCSRAGTPCAPGRPICASHHAKEIERQKKRFLQRAASKTLCIDCPAGNRRPAVRAWRCDRHADADLARRRAARAAKAKRFLFFGEALTLAEIASITGQDPYVLAARINLQGMTIERAALPGIRA